VEPGLYMTFFREGESFDEELPPIGPLEHVVVRDGSLIADRKDGERADFDGGGRWVEAEYEFQRAIGKEPGGARRPDLRIVAPQGVYLRFVSFGAGTEQDAVPELGPYAVVVVGKDTVRADGDRLASRAKSEQNLWQLTAVGGRALAGVIRSDIAFRTRSTTYHPGIKSFRPTQPAAAPTKPAKPLSPAPRAASPPASPRVASPAPPPTLQPAAPAPAPRSVEVPTITLRDRIRSEQPTRLDMVASADGEQREWAGAAWRLRYVIIASLVALVAVLSVPSILSLMRGGGTAGASAVSITTPLTSPDWTYRVGIVRRVESIGNSQARGIYLVVQLAATNRRGAGAQLHPSNFSVAAAGGDEYRALATTSGVYSSTENPAASYAWPTEFPVGQSVVVPLVFDVDPSVSGAQLVILDVPSTRVRLE
jgi:hypothetical protein